MYKELKDLAKGDKVYKVSSSGNIIIYIVTKVSISKTFQAAKISVRYHDENCGRAITIVGHHSATKAVDRNGVIYYTSMDSAEYYKSIISDSSNYRLFTNSLRSVIKIFKDNLK